MRTDERYMRRALAAARKGIGRTNPNPPVGAVLVKGGRVVAEAYHKRCGMPHAEVLAIAAAGTRAAGATLYVTLEPCDHVGRTPPCTRAIIESGIRRVVVGTVDPNPLTRGKGLRRLRRAGISVTSGVCEGEARELIGPFTKWVTRGLPYVTVKMAESLDGKIATRTGESRWISSPSSRRTVNRLRGVVDAVMVGLGTVIHDDPQLLPRYAGARMPARIVVDSGLRMPISARLLRTRSGAPVYVATAVKQGAKTPRISAKVRRLEKAGARVLFARGRGGRVDLAALMRALAELSIMHVLVEGGGELVASLTAERLVDEYLFFVAPLIIGGRGAPTAVSGKGVARLADALRVERMEVCRSGDDIMIRARI